MTIFRLGIYFVKLWPIKTYSVYKDIVTYTVQGPSGWEKISKDNPICKYKSPIEV